MYVPFPARSPFPGMDPYLEVRWSDVHVKLIGFIGEAIQPLLPANLRARGEERLLLEVDDREEKPRGYRSDVSVVETGSQATVAPPTSAGGVATVEPVIIRRDPGPVVQRWVQIIDVASGNRVVTAIEILSPWNKAAGRLNRQYLRKLEDYGRAGVSVVEVDLLRYPTRTRLNVTEHDLPAERRAPYMTCVRVGWDPETWRAYPMSLRLALPTIPIPLREKEPEIGLTLQPIIERVYTAGGHDDIDYSKPPDPPLERGDALWASELLAVRGGVKSA